MKKIFIIIPILIFVLSGCGVDTKEAEKFLKELSKNKTVSQYLSEAPTLDYTNPIKKYYDFKINLSMNKKFTQLSNKEKYKILYKVYELIEDKGFSKVISCGDKYTCSVDEVHAKYKNDDYTIDFKHGDSLYQLEKNDEVIFDLEDEKEKRNENSSEEEAQSADDQTIYNYMENEFNRITNYGENYTPEIHDSMVTELASEKFGITVDEANEIYVSMSMNKYK
ncbi:MULTISPECIES: hypothetical protein [Bacillus]|uniref:hypothetical protein n=1 Tax=Bacillus TaxID=1386 RepID=UPI0007D0450E|nr:MULTISPECIES: hypothetical protein [Bacillus amyloliquefaciens group]MCA1213481.1 hypothetical protein [Bacillus amyloliquefaciens]OAL90334.1 hypothetical protein AY610_05675 [Bacillus velezensis]UUI53975.1 hypothetical protein NPS25_06245 [Bacillus velezensis]